MRLIGTGRDCDIFDRGDGTVLRRRRRGGVMLAEATVMRHVAAYGYPCPTVHHTDGPDMVLDRVEGPTMSDEVLADPTIERARAAGFVLAELHRRLHELPPLPGADGALLHRDLHPENVLMTASGPVVIDWTNAAVGSAEVDLAMTWVILEPVARSLQPARLLLEAFLDAVGRDSAREGLETAATYRLADDNLRPEEAAVVRELLHAERP